jgi:20S proteasome alpha/beta subunit
MSSFLRLFSLILLCCAPTLVDSSSAAGQETLVGVVGKDFIVLGADSSTSQSIALTARNLDKIAVIVDPLLEQSDVSRQQTIVAAAAGDAADSDRLLGQLSAHAAIREYEASVGCDVKVLDFASGTMQEAQIASPPGLNVEDVANLARATIASSLRSRSPLSVCLLVAGMLPVVGDDEEEGAKKGDTEKAADIVSFSKNLQRQVEQASLPYRTIEEVTEPPDTLSPFVAEELESTSVASSTFRLEPRLYWLDSYGSCQKLQYGAHGLGANFCLSILDQGFRDDMTRDEAVDLIRDCFRQLRMRYVINSPEPPCIKCIDASGCQLMRDSEVS